MRAFGLSPVARLSFGLVALLVSMVLFLDIVGIVPNHQQMVKALRQRLSENLGLQVAQFLGQQDMIALGKSLREVAVREADLQSVALRKSDGSIVIQVGEHASHWRPPSDGQSDMDNVRVPLSTNDQAWGNLELAFRPLSPNTLAGWLRDPLVATLLVLSAAGFTSFYLYLRRALLYLDPTTAVPERVRLAFDILSDGIMILDRDGRILLTNTAFRRLHPDAKQDLTGRDIRHQTWLHADLDPDPKAHPWHRAIAEGIKTDDEHLAIRQPDGSVIRTVINVTPVQGPSGDVRGCLLSIDDVTELHRINEELRKTMAELESARHEVEKRNQELQTIANRDPLTGCLNRRAFFALLEELYVAAKADHASFCCIMADIDHFKSFNDRYGHAVGDEVIRSMVRCLQSELRQNDLLCRYGGEEFCMILPLTDLQLAVEVAERLRTAVEQQAGSAIRSIEGLQITASFGVALFDQAMLDPAELIGRADEALYRSKHDGRNRVRF